MQEERKTITARGLLEALGAVLIFLTYSIFLAVSAASFANKTLLKLVSDQAEEVSSLKEYIGKNKSSSYKELVKTIQKIPQIVIEDVNNQQSAKDNPQIVYIEPEYEYSDEELFYQVNLFRSQNDRRPLEKDDCLCELANIRKDELVLAGELDNHKGFENRDVFGMCPQFTFIGENLAKGYLDAQGVVFEGWEKSEGHRYAMDREEFTHGCVATENGISVLILGGQSP